jgi:hypothetical protein
MANSDTILALQGFGATTASRNQLASITGIAATTETIFTMGTDSGTNVNAFLPIVGQTGIYGRANPMSININTATLLDQLGAKAGERGASAPWYNTSSFDGRGLRFRVQGRFVSGAASNTLTIKMYLQTVANGAILAGGKLLGTAAMGGAAMAASSGNFIAEVTAMWDSVSAYIQGAEQWGAATTAAGTSYYQARAINATSVAIAAPLSGWLFIASATFASGPGNAVTPIEMAYEDV